MPRFLFVLFALGVAACASVSRPCQKRIADCVRRCEASGADPAPVRGPSPEQSMSYCESRCSGCGPDPKATPTSAGRPTPTGYAN